MNSVKLALPSGSYMLTLNVDKDFIEVCVVPQPVANSVALDTPAADEQDEEQKRRDDIFKSIEENFSRLEIKRVCAKSRKKLCMAVLTLCGTTNESVTNRDLQEHTLIDSDGITRWLTAAVQVGFLTRFGQEKKPAYQLSSRYIELNKNEAASSESETTG